jgi:hypothetical protein
MTLFLISGLISVSVMVLIVRMLLSLSRPTMVSVILYTDAHKYNSSTVEKIQKPFLGQTEVVKPQVRLFLCPSLQQDVTLTGTQDISGIGLRWAVCSPTISLKVLKSLQNPLKNGCQKTPSSKSEKIIREQK